MRTAVCQFAAGTDVAANTEACHELISEAAAQGADLAILPEISMYRNPDPTAPFRSSGQELDGPFATAMRRAARAAGCAVIVGMLELSHESDGETARDYNTVLTIDTEGDIAALYRKVHLYDAFGYRESDIYVPADIAEPAVTDIAGVRVGVLTCYDLRFPEPFRQVVDAGAELIAVPAAWVAGPMKERHWTTLLAARAIENTVYIAGSGQTGPHCCGQSQLLDPFGAVLAGVGDRPGFGLAEVNAERVAEARRINPSLANRRFTVAGLHE